MRSSISSRSPERREADFPPRTSHTNSLRSISHTRASSDARSSAVATAMGPRHTASLSARPRHHAAGSSRPSAGATSTRQPSPVSTGLAGAAAPAAAFLAL